MASYASQARFVGTGQRWGLARTNRRHLRIVRAEEEDDQSSFFSPNKLATRGYLSEDSAGQENIFSIQPRQYVQGSDLDETTGAPENTFYGILGGIVAGLVIISGTGALFVQSSSDATATRTVSNASELASLSEYKAKFLADTRPPQTVEAPDVEGDA